MTLKEFLEYREHRFDKEAGYGCSDTYAAYKEGWHDACRDIQEVLEAHGFNLDIPLD